MAVFVAGVVGIVFFYMVILGVGFWASRKQRDESEEEMMLAGRRLNGCIGTLTLIATWVGPAFVNGASTVLFERGLLWLQAPVGYSLSLLVAAVLFIKPLRDMKAVTLMDPFQKLYGDRIGALLVIPAISKDIFVVASTLNALGTSLAVIGGVDPAISIIGSAVFVAAYTSVGGMYSVAYTDVVQLFLVIVGLVLCIPFAIGNEATSVEKLENINWTGKIKRTESWMWADNMLLFILGGCPVQMFAQRILAMKTTKLAQRVASISSFFCMFIAVPASILGVVARAVNWDEVPSFNRTLTASDSNNILPIVLLHLTPDISTCWKNNHYFWLNLKWVAFFGLGAVTAAMMSSADSCILSFSSILTRNVYKNLLRPKASQREIAWVLRATVLLISTASTIIALTGNGIYYLAVLGSELIYTIMFPNLFLLCTCAKKINSYGLIVSFFLGILFRILSGEPGIGIPAVIQFPGFDAARGIQLFPHKTFCMLICMVSHIVISQLAQYLFEKKYLHAKYDCLQQFTKAEKFQHEVYPMLEKNAQSNSH